MPHCYVEFQSCDSCTRLIKLNMYHRCEWIKPQITTKIKTIIDVHYNTVAFGNIYKLKETSNITLSK